MLESYFQLLIGIILSKLFNIRVFMCMQETGKESFIANDLPKSLIYLEVSCDLKKIPSLEGQSWIPYQSTSLIQRIKLETLSFHVNFKSF